MCKADWHQQFTGNWIASTPIPEQSLETRETRLQGKRKQLLLAFVRKVLCWLPEDRQTAEDLLDDQFLDVAALAPATTP